MRQAILLFVLQLIFVSIVSSDDLEDWFIQQGGIINKCKYDRVNERMVATEDIKKGEVLVKADTTFLFPLGKPATNMTTYDVARALHRNKDPKWKVYIDSLPKTCQTAFCGNKVSNTTLVNTTIFFERYLEKEREQLDSEELYIPMSLVLSRAWKKKGMLPVFDRFNHNSEKGYIVHFAKDGSKTIQLHARVDYSKGEEVFDSYGDYSTIEWLYNWNMLSTDTKKDACIDYIFQKHLHHDNQKKRAKCLGEAGADLKFEDVVSEMRAALHTDPGEADLGAVLGLSRWFDNNLK